MNFILRYKVLIAKVLLSGCGSDSIFGSPLRYKEAFMKFPSNQAGLTKEKTTFQLKSSLLSLPTVKEYIRGERIIST
jgi:hypothetical protein